jgi:all-trans-retinol 13,14-reductase
MAASSTFDVIIIGAGLGGLAAGTQLARAGKRLLVLEKEANFGGAATRYRHAGMIIEASLHDMDGHSVTAKGGLFDRLGIAQTSAPLEIDNFYRVSGGPLGTSITVPKGLDGARDALRIALPSSGKAIDHWIEGVRGVVSTFDAMEGLTETGNGLLPLLASGRWLSVLRHARSTLSHRMRALCGDDEALKCAVGAMIAYFDDDPKALAWLLYGGIWGRYVEHGSYFFEAGGQSVAMAMVHAIHEGGGVMLRSSAATGLLFDANGRLGGVRYRQRGAIEEATAPVVIVNAAPQHLVKWLPERQQEPFLARLSGFEPSISLFTMVFGLSCPPQSLGIGEYTHVHYPRDMTRYDEFASMAARFGEEPGPGLPPFILTDHSRFQTIAHGGLYPVTVAGVDRFAWWRGLSVAEERTRRSAWLTRMARELERLYPGFAAAVGHQEMATSRTLYNRLGTPQGEVYGFRPTPSRLFGQPPFVECGIKGLLFGSAYTVSGGYAGAMHGGMMAASHALKLLRKP